MIKILFPSFFIFLLLSLNSFVPYYKLSTEEFSQYEFYRQDKQFLRNAVYSCRMYDQFTTDGIFDVLPFQGTVVDVYSRQYGYLRTFEEGEKAKNEHHKRNERMTRFFVLAYAPHPTKKGLDDKQAPCTFLMRDEITGMCYAPTQIKEIELSPELYHLFSSALGGDEMLVNKVAYSVVFEGKSLPLEDILLEIRTAKGYKVLNWKQKKERPVREDRYWL